MLGLGLVEHPQRAPAHLGRVLLIHRFHPCSKNGTKPRPIHFSAGALALEPGGDPVYAAVAVRTTDTTTLDGTLALQGAVLGAGDSADLAAALDLRVAYAEDSLAACDADAFGPGSIIVDTTLAAGTPATSTQAVDKEAGNVLIYCFELSLPADESTNQALMGQTVSPSWEIRAES